MDLNGVIDEAEFNQMAIDLLRQEMNLGEGEELSEDDVRECEEGAKKEFRSRDKRKNGLLGPELMRVYLKAKAGQISCRRNCGHDGLTADYFEAQNCNVCLRSSIQKIV